MIIRDIGSLNGTFCKLGNSLIMNKKFVYLDL